MLTKRVTRRSLLRWSGGAATLGLLAACSPAAPNPAAATVPVASQAPAAATKAPEPKRGGTLTLGMTAGVQEFNPMNMTVGNAPFIRSVYNTLLRYDESLQPQPELADKWQLAPDGKSISLNLRQGVKYHSGREFTSADVRFSVEFGQTNDRAIMRELFKTVKQVETPDKYSVTLSFATPNPGVYDLLDVLFMIDRETIEDRAKTAVGTGPFRVDKYVPGDRVEMLAFKEYWESGKPYLDKYIARQIPDPSALTINLESGALDYVHSVSLQDAARLQESGGKYVVVRGNQGNSIYDVGMNVKVEPLTDKRVRQAIAWSIDRERFCKTALKGFSTPTCLIWPSYSWAYFQDMEGKIGYDLDKARSLLKEAGLETGFETELRTSSKTDQGYTDLAIIMQADLKKIGINAKVSDLDSTLYTNKNQSGDLIMMTHAYGRASRDPATTLSGAKAWYLEKEGGWCHYEGAEYEQLRKDLQVVIDQEKRKQICRRIQEIVLDECFTVTVAARPRIIVYQSYVRGATLSLDDYPFVGNIWLDK